MKSSTRTTLLYSLALGLFAMSALPLAAQEAEVAEEEGRPAFLVESEADLDRRAAPQFVALVDGDTVLNVDTALTTRADVASQHGEDADAEAPLGVVVGAEGADALAAATLSVPEPGWLDSGG